MNGERKWEEYQPETQKMQRYDGPRSGKLGTQNILQHILYKIKILETR